MKKITTIILLILSMQGYSQQTIKVAGGGTSGGATKYSTTEYGMLIDSATTNLYKFRADSTVMETQASAVNRAAVVAAKVLTDSIALVNNIVNYFAQNVQYDRHAIAYIDSEMVSDVSRKIAINQFVKDLKSINAIENNFVNFDTPAVSKRKAIYLFPGIGALNVRNLIDPRNLDSAYRGVVTGTAVINSFGVKYLASSYLDIKLNTSTKLDTLQNSVEYAVSEDFPNTATVMEIGSGSTFRYGHKQSSGFQYWIDNGAFNFKPIYLDNTSTALIQVNKLSNSVSALKLKRNGILIDSNATAISGSYPNANFKIGGGFGSPQRRFSYVAVGDAIVSDSANKLYTAAIERLNYRLGRLRTVNIVIDGHSFTSGSVLITPIVTQLAVKKGIDPYNVYSFGVGGDKVDSIKSRVLKVNKWIKKDALIPFKNVLVIWIGTNDLATVAAYDSLKSYTQYQITAGWDKVILFTCTPRVTLITEPTRAIFNNLLRTDLGLNPKVHIIDTDLITELSDPSNTTYYSDGLHLTTLGTSLVVSRLVTYLESQY